MEDRIRKAVTEALSELGIAGTPFDVEWPADMSHGDYAINAALKAFGPLVKSRIPGEEGSHFTVGQTLNFVEKYKNPREFAKEIVPYLQKELGVDAAKIEIAGPGFINVTLSQDAIIRKLEETRDEDWGKGAANAGKRVVVEYSCPNPFKEMHIGHLMSTIIGEAVSRVVENSGAAVIRDSYGGDVGPHVAKALWALRKDGVTDVANAAEVDRAYAHGAKAYEASETAKAEIDVLNQDIYKGEDQGLMDLWRKSREVCLEAFRELYQVVGTKFDYFFFESDTAPIGMDIVKRGLAGGIFKESDGAIIYEGEKKGLHTLVFVTSRGTPTYEAKELGLAFYKEERAPSDISYILTAAEQVGHFAVVKAALEEVAPALGAKTHHIPHGFLRLTTGKMSSREGNTVTARGLLADMLEKAKEKNEDPIIAEQVAVAAIKYMILRQAPGGDIIFDPEKSLSLEGDSGPYLQYAFVRAQKLLSYDSKSAGDAKPDAPYLIERLIVRFPEVAARAERERAPHHITQYLTRLAGEWNAFYANEQVLGSEEEAYKQRVARAFSATMKNGLGLLGIPVPERM